MKKNIIRLVAVITLIAIGLVGISSIALAADPPEKVEGFICPVLGGNAGQMGNHTGLSGPLAEGEYTVSGPPVTVPEHATNAGFPATGGYYHPGEVGYTAIWNLENAP